MNSAGAKSHRASKEEIPIVLKYPRLFFKQIEEGSQGVDDPHSPKFASLELRKS
jgi:hypothetical protein